MMFNKQKKTSMIIQSSSFGSTAQHFGVFNNSLITFTIHQSLWASSDVVVCQFEHPILYILKFWGLQFLDAFISK